MEQPVVVFPGGKLGEDAMTRIRGKFVVHASTDMGSGITVAVLFPHNDEPTIEDWENLQAQCAHLTSIMFEISQSLKQRQTARNN